MNELIGKQVRDRITGYGGVAVGRTEWLTGCATVAIQGRLDDKGQPPELFWFDEVRVDVLASPEPLHVDATPEQEKGGPQPSPRNPSLRGG